jgi:hypothetical protein
VTCGDTTTDPKSAEHIETTLAADVVVTPETPLAAKCIEDPSQATSPSKAIAMATTVGVAVLETLLTVEAVPPATDEGVEDVVAPALSPSPTLLLVSPRTCFITNVTKPVEVTRGAPAVKRREKILPATFAPRRTSNSFNCVSHLGFGNSTNATSSEGLERYARVFDQPLCHEHVKALAALFGFQAPPPPRGASAICGEPNLCIISGFLVILFILVINGIF